MGAVRQAATVLIYAFVPVLLVVGSLTLALTEGHPSQVTSPAPSSAASSPTGAPTSMETSARPAPTSARTATPIKTLSLPTASATLASATTTAATKTETATSTPSFPTASVQAQLLAAPTMACGPFPGWILGYVVRPGDTLYRIAMRFRTSVADLVQGNCKPSSAIYPGERLWVPYHPTSRWQFRAMPTHWSPWRYQSQPVVPPAIPYP
jgi:hypothetical protein